jgi:exonuclease III
MVKPGRLFWVLIFFLKVLVAQSQIFLDGNFDDWRTVAPLVIDPVGDVPAGNIDFRTLKIFDTEEFIFFFLETGKEINLQENHNIQLLMDTDLNPATGLNIRDLGVDLLYNFGNRSGNFFANNNTIPVFHQQIGLISLPSVTGDVFEFCLRKKAMINGLPLFPETGFKILLRNGASGDYLEVNAEAATYEFKGQVKAEVPSYSIARKSEKSIRIVSYNVERDGLVGNPACARLLKAIDPDIIGFQEIYTTDLANVKAQIEDWLPGHDWYASKAGPDCILISKYPITATEVLEYGGSSSSGNGAFLLESPEFDDKKMLVVNAHLPCCDNNEDRQDEVDGIMAFIREVQNGNGPFNLPSNSPIFILGDMNLVGLAEQLNTFYTGDIKSNGQFGIDFSPDWDGTALSDCGAFASGSPLAYTWYSETSNFSPGKLDFIFYSDAVAELENAFGLETEELPADSLNRYNLQITDSRQGADHIPVVADFVLVDKTGLFEIDPTIQMHGFPNPSNQAVNFALNPTNASKAKVEIKNFFTLRNVLIENYPVKNQLLRVETSGLQSGLYLMKIELDGKIYFARQLVQSF